jgi:hypothetical protein
MREERKVGRTYLDGNHGRLTLSVAHASLRRAALRFG